MMKHSALIAPFLACGALPSGAGELPNNMKPSNDGERYLASIQEKNSIAFYTEYIPKWGMSGRPCRKNPLETQLKRPAGDLQEVNRQERFCRAHF